MLSTGRFSQAGVNNLFLKGRSIINKLYSVTHIHIQFLSEIDKLCSTMNLVPDTNWHQTIRKYWLELDNIRYNMQPGENKIQI